jgi:TM2 domain-containing membrane protein YozV
LIAIKRDLDILLRVTFREINMSQPENPSNVPPGSEPPPPPPGYGVPPGYPPPPGYPAYTPRPAYLQEASSKKLVTGLLGIFLGAFGVHKFVLGYTTAGVIMLVVSLTCVGYGVMHIIGIIEGILYLTKSDEEFYQTYMANKREWF